MFSAGLLTATAISRKTTARLRITKCWRRKRKSYVRSLIGIRTAASALVPLHESLTSCRFRPEAERGAGSDRWYGPCCATLPMLVEPASEKRSGENDGALHDQCDGVVFFLPARVPTKNDLGRTGLRSPYLP